MLNWWLILLLVIIPIIVAVLSVYLLFYFKSEEEEGEYVMKGIVVLATALAIGVVLLVPLDVANSPDIAVSQKYHDTLNTQLMWQIVLWFLAVFTLTICPFAMFYYEAWDPDKPSVRKQITHATLLTGIIVVLVLGGTIALYFTVGVSIVKFYTYTAYPQLVDVNSYDVLYNGTAVTGTMEVDVSFPTYFMGVLCFLGWIVFIIYGGVGMAILPFDLIMGFVRRPKAISATRFAELMNVYLSEADVLLEMAQSQVKYTRGTISSSTKNKVKVLRTETYVLETQQDELIWAYKNRGGSPFIVFGKLFLGICCAVLSVAWFLHIFIHNAFNVGPFLNVILIKLNEAFALFGVIAYAILIFYLMVATLHGQVALGLRLIFFQIHPLKRHDTLLNSMLFNLSLLLLTSFAIVAFAAQSFQDYAPRAAVNGLINIYVLHLKGIGEFIAWAAFPMLGVSLIALAWSLIFSRKRKKRRGRHIF